MWRVIRAVRWAFWCRSRRKWRVLVIFARPLNPFFRSGFGHEGTGRENEAGSRARGTQRPDSDVDVALLLRNVAQDFVGTKLEMADLAFDVLLETGVLISPFPVALEDWNHPERHANPLLLRNIDREGVRL